MNQEKIGKFILKLRMDNNLSQAKFADKIGVTYQAVSKWENGRGIPDIEMLKKISEVFDVDIDEIINGEKKKQKSICMPISEVCQMWRVYWQTTPVESVCSAVNSSIWNQTLTRQRKSSLRRIRQL